MSTEQTFSERSHDARSDRRGRPEVSVIIPTHQRREALRRALTSLGSQAATAPEFEAVIAIDGSTDGTKEMLEALEVPYELRTVTIAHRGRAAACNAALELARGEVSVILDDDMEVGPGFVARHLRHHPPGTRLCVLGAAPVAVDSSSPRVAGHVQRKFAAHLERLPDQSHLEHPRSFYSGNASLRTDVLREVGGFDESFELYGNEDVELSLRLRAAGVGLRYDPEAVARQHYDKDLAGLAGDTFSQGTTAVRLARAHPGVFDALRLATPRDASRPWLALRTMLLWGTRRTDRVRSAIVAVGRVLERLGLWRQPLFYRALLDYAFWAGADAELRGNDEGELRLLTVELRRGPIGLLLHR